MNASNSMTTPNPKAKRKLKTQAYYVNEGVLYEMIEMIEVKGRPQYLVRDIRRPVDAPGEFIDDAFARSFLFIQEFDAAG